MLGVMWSINGIKGPSWLYQIAARAFVKGKILLAFELITFHYVSWLF